MGVWKRDSAVPYISAHTGTYLIPLEQIRFGRVVIPNLTLPKNPGSNLILVTEIEIQFVVFPDESRKLPRIITAAREHLPSAAQRSVFRHSPPIPGSKLLLLAIG